MIQTCLRLLAPLYYTLNEKEIGSIRVLYDTTIPKATYQDYFRKTLTYFI